MEENLLKIRYRMKLSLVVCTKNEEANIERCLTSFDIADEIIVVDSGSTDKTVEIAKSLNAKVYEKEWLGYGPQKNFAISKANGEWILLLDADEFATDEIKESIKQAIETEKYKVYELPIKEYFMGQVIHHGRGYTSPVRLYKKGSGYINDKQIHEEFITDHKIGRLNGYMIHHSATSPLERIRKILRDIELESNNHEWHVSKKMLCIDPLKYFLSYFIKKSVWKDGLAGYILLMMYTFQMFIQNAIQYHKALKSNKIG